MDKELLTLVGLRIAAIILNGEGKTGEAAFLNGVVRARRAGRNVDAAMARYADLMGTDDEPGMQELAAALNAELDEFLSRGPDGKVPEAT